MEHGKVELRKGKDVSDLELKPLPEDASEPIAYMISRIKANQPIEGLTAIDINVDVIRIIDLAKESVRTGKAVRFQ